MNTSVFIQDAKVVCDTLQQAFNQVDFNEMTMNVVEMELSESLIQRMGHWLNTGNVRKNELYMDLLHLAAILRNDIERN